MFNLIFKFRSVKIVLKMFLEKNINFRFELSTKSNSEKSLGEWWPSDSQSMTVDFSAISLASPTLNPEVRKSSKTATSRVPCATCKARHSRFPPKSVVVVVVVAGVISAAICRISKFHNFVVLCVWVSGY